MDWLQQLYDLYGTSYDYPYTDYQQINLDFIFYALREIGESIESLFSALSGKQDKPREITYVTYEDANTITVDNINMQSAVISYTGRANGGSNVRITAVYRDNSTTVEVSHAVAISNLSTTSLTSISLLSYCNGGSVVLVNPKSRAANSDLNIRIAAVDFRSNYQLSEITFTNNTTSVNFLSGACVTIKEVL